jgi:xyloglucan-specific endo-beta-1,4-glucanase
VKEHVCNDGDSIIMGKYWLNSNLWGASTGSGSQCLWDTSADAETIAWGTSWNWTGQADSIKSYNAAVLGWHWGWKLPQTGLPLHLSAHQRVHTTWSFHLTQTTPGGINVAYDLWLSADPHQDLANADAEIMIWLYQSGDIRPIGRKQSSATLGGIRWDLWEGSLPQCGWPVYSFVRPTNTTSQSLNLTDFFDSLIPRGLSRSSYLISVEAGAEVFTGAGRLDTRSYSVEIDATIPTE